MAPKIHRGQSLSAQMYTILRHRIQTMDVGENRLPSEEDLSREFGVSRAVIREACSKLSGQGYLAKATGRGLVGHPSAFAMENRIDLISDFKKLMQEDFKKVTLQIAVTGVQTPSDLLKNHPWEGDDHRVFTMDWTYLGDGEPAIFGHFEIPLSSFATLPTQKITTKDLPEFSQTYLIQPISYCAMTLHCCLHQPCAQLFSIQENCPVQRFDEVLYDVDDRPVGYSRFYLHPEKIPLSVLTKFR